MGYEIRRIVPDDREEIIRISSQIWEGDDYIPLVFDSWVKDQEGEFVALLFAGRIIGFLKLTYLTETDLWLEGLRKDIKTEHKGVGKRLNDYFFSKLKKEKRISSIRFSTYIDNVESRHITEKAGFRVFHVMSNKYYTIEEEEKQLLLERGGSERKFRGAELSFEEMATFVEHSSFLKDSRNCITIDWKAYPYSRKFLREAFYEPGQYIAKKRGNKISGLLLYNLRFLTMSGGSLSFFDVEDDDIARELFEEMKTNCILKNWTEIEAKIPTKEPYLRTVGSLDMKSWEMEDDFYIYEYPLERLREGWEQD
jgi:RimJ/RimL family protein N-acetyltransferase